MSTILYVVGIIYVIGLVVVVFAVLAFLGLQYDDIHSEHGLAPLAPMARR